MKKLFWVMKGVCAAILLQTLFFKFTAAPESVYIFTKLGMEPWGRILSGVVELIAGLLLLTPRYDGIGGVLALGTISGALFFHLTTLGIEVMNDKGYLFILATVVFVLSAVIVWVRRKQIPLQNRIFK